MILSGNEIKKYLDISSTQGIVDKGISIHPYPQHIGPNSVDLTLANKLLTINPTWVHTRTINLRDGGESPIYKQIYDTKVPPSTTEITIPEEGFLLEPQSFYLGSTVEKTKTLGFVPFIEGRSTIARYGLLVHLSAGVGDSGFGLNSSDGNTWTLEIFNVNNFPVKVYPGMRICQIMYFTMEGNGPVYNGHYVDQDGPLPPQL